MFGTLGLLLGVWAAALPGLKAKLALSDGALGIALLAVALGAVSSAVVVAAVASRAGTGRWVAAGGLASAAAMALPPLAGSLPQLVACAAVVGLALGALDIAVNGHASDIERRWGAPIMSSFHAAFSAGGLLGSAAGGALAPSGLARQMGLPALAVLPLVALAVPFLGRGAREPRGRGVPLALPERAALGLCATALLMFLIEGGMADWSGIYLQVAGASPRVAAAGYAGFSLFTMGGRLAGDAAVRVLGARRVVVAGSLLAAAGLGLAILVPRPGTAVLGFGLVGLGVANIVPVVFSAAGRLRGSPSAGVATIVTVGYAGFIGGPPLIGAVAAAVGLRGALGLLLGAALLVAGVGGVDRAFARREPT